MAITENIQRTDSISSYSSQSSDIDSIDTKIKELAKKTFTKENFWVFAKGVAITGVILLTLAFLASNPAGWTVSALAITFIIGIALGALISSRLNNTMNDLSGISKKHIENQYESAFFTDIFKNNESINPNRTESKNSNADIADKIGCVAIALPAFVAYFVLELVRASLSIPFLLANGIERTGRYTISCISNSTPSTKKIHTVTERIWSKIRISSVTLKLISLNGVKVIQGEQYRRFLFLFNTLKEINEKYSKKPDPELKGAGSTHSMSDSESLIDPSSFRTENEQENSQGVYSNSIDLCLSNSNAKAVLQASQAGDLYQDDDLREEDFWV